MPLPAAVWIPDDGAMDCASVDLNSGLECIGRFECLALLRREVVGRLAVVIDGKPEIFPVNYFLDDHDMVVFQTDAGAKLAGAVGHAVAFEVDQLDRATRSGWSVVVQGTAHQVPLSDAPPLRARSSSEGAAPWPRPRRPYLIRISPDVVSGRRIPSQAGS